MSVTIRPARLDDAAAISAVNCASIRGICSAVYTPYEIDVWTALLTPDKYLEPLRTQIMFVAEREGVIVGYSQLDPARELVLAVYVTPDAARAGVGSALLEKLEWAARERGLKRLVLDATLNAETFYTRSGYRPARMNAYPVTPEVSLACIHMEKTLE
jgi:GNAT superfamily N-acetyltransferase